MPSMKLCSASPNMIMYATVVFEVGCSRFLVSLAGWNKITSLWSRWMDGWARLFKWSFSTTQIRIIFLLYNMWNMWAWNVI
jgi:hypothetical protein